MTFFEIYVPHLDTSQTFSSKWDRMIMQKFVKGSLDFELKLIDQISGSKKEEVKKLQLCNHDKLLNCFSTI